MFVLSLFAGFPLAWCPIEPRLWNLPFYCWDTQRIKCENGGRYWWATHSYKAGHKEENFVSIRKLTIHKLCSLPNFCHGVFSTHLPLHIITYHHISWQRNLSLGLRKNWAMNINGLCSYMNFLYALVSGSYMQIFWVKFIQTNVS